MRNKLDSEARKIARQNNFKINKKIYQAFSVSFDDYRNVIYDGTYNGKPAILKIYNEERINDEPMALKYYNKINKSKILLAPKLYKYKILSPTRGWSIMEKISGKLYKSPLGTDQRREFLKLYLIYRRAFPKKSYKKPTLINDLRADEFHIFRINKWLKMAAEKQAEDKLMIIKSHEFLPRYRKAASLIKKEFKSRKMIFCHGHFKPKEIFITSNNNYYLTDFGHVKMYPEGYELAFMIWADYLIPGDWKLDYKKWKIGIENWINDLRPIAQKLKIKKYDKLIKISLIERAMGTILADIRLSNKPKLEKIKRIELLYKLIDDLSR